MRKTIFFIFLSTGFILSACIGTTGQQTETDPGQIYFDYKITAEEGNDSVTVMLKFREYDEYGAAIRVGGAKSVIFDDKPVPADSTFMTGPYYAITQHVKDFSGRHTILVTCSDKKKYKEEFFFRPFTLKSIFGDTITREKLILQFDGLDKKDVVRVLMTDTSFTGNGINRLDTVWNNKLIISRDELSFLENGPINVEIIKENERPVSSSTEAGGTISIYYIIRREFWLKD